jgi:hypothetical protein
MPGWVSKVTVAPLQASFGFRAGMVTDTNFRVTYTEQMFCVLPSGCGSLLWRGSASWRLC